MKNVGRRWWNVPERAENPRVGGSIPSQATNFALMEIAAR
jgi:hypothetical protein